MILPNKNLIFFPLHQFKVFLIFLFKTFYRYFKNTLNYTISRLFFWLFFMTLFWWNFSTFSENVPLKPVISCHVSNHPVKFFNEMRRQLSSNQRSVLCQVSVPESVQNLEARNISVSNGEVTAVTKIAKGQFQFQVYFISSLRINFY